MSTQHYKAELEEGVQGSIDNIIRSIKAYAFDNGDSAYQVVAVELRKLLLDTNAAASFLPKSKKRKRQRNRNLFELRYGNGQNILLRSFVPNPQTKREREARDWLSVTPPIYRNRIDILAQATQRARLVRLPIWLNEPFVFDHEGVAMRVGDVIKDIADKEGAHIISSRGREPKGDRDIGIAFITTMPEPEDLPSQDFVKHWEQFVIDAGMRLLNAQYAATGQRVVAHGLTVPQRQVDTHSVELKRSELGS